MRIVFSVLLLVLSGTVSFSQEQPKGARTQELLREYTIENHRIHAPAELREEARARLHERSAHLMQRRTDGEDYPVSDGLFIEAEIHAALNPSDHDNMIVSAIRGVIVQGQLAGISCPLYSTTDGGWTWTESGFLTEPSDPDGIPYGGGDPVLAFESDGTAHFTWLNFFLTADFGSLISEICWASSDDGGYSWVQPEKTVLCDATMSTQETTPRFVDKQWMATDRSGGPRHGNIYVAFMRSRTVGPTIVVLSKPAGASAFVPGEVYVSPDSMALVQFTSIDVDDQGGVHVSYFASADEENYALWHTLSTDGGASFGTPTKISDIVVPRFSAKDSNGTIDGLNPERVYPCPQLAVGRGSHASEVYMTWTGRGITERESNGVDIYFCRSTDYGGTWSVPTVVNDDPRGIDRDQFYSSIAVNDAGVIALTWYDRREDEANRNARYYIAVSRNGGESFTRNEAVASLPMNMFQTTIGNSNFGIGEYTQVLITDDAIIPFWCDGRKNNGNLQIYSANIDLNTLEVRQHAPIGASFRIQEIWPQPAGAELQVRCSVAHAMEVRLLLTDMLGRVITEQAFQADSPGSYVQRFSTSQLAAGSYQILMLTNEGSAGRMLRVL